MHQLTLHLPAPCGCARFYGLHGAQAYADQHGGRMSSAVRCMLPHLPPDRRISSILQPPFRTRFSHDFLPPPPHPLFALIEHALPFGAKQVSDEINSLLDDHIVLSQQFTFSPYKEPFEERITDWDRKLRLVQARGHTHTPTHTNIHAHTRIPREI
eukprot:6189805-Pleurochrysis_carterae.AAC.7